MAKARKRSPHPGVVLIKPHGRYTSWRARYQDPDSGKLKFERLDPVALRTAEARRDWAIRKARTIARRAVELAEGAIRKEGLPLGEAFAAFFEARRNLRESTVEGYRKRADAFVAWGQTAGVLTLDDITRPRLLEYRDAVIGAPSSRGDATRSDHFVNRVLRETSVPLHWMLERRMLPACSTDDLKLGLKRVRASIDRIDTLGRGEPAALLQAALADDRRRVQYEDNEIVSPFILVLLLSGMRFSEALGLTWKQLDLNALSHDGTKCGEAYLKAESVKTKQGRVIAFDVSPSLRDLFLALKATHQASVFPGLGRPVLESRRKALKKQGAPSFSYQSLRRTCGSYLTCAPGLYGSASAFMSAKRLGHSVVISERHYVGSVRGIPHEAKTLEQAMSITDEAQQVIALVRERHASQVAAE